VVSSSEATMTWPAAKLTQSQITDTHHLHIPLQDCPKSLSVPTWVATSGFQARQDLDVRVAESVKLMTGRFCRRSQTCANPRSSNSSLK
jgi:hypothetical protein